MPRLSTIIPHRGNSHALEATILSLLENQTGDCEIILVHDGSYADPYQLSDELLIIEETNSNPLALLNVGLMAACAPIVCVLSPGVCVTDCGWLRAAELIDPSAGVNAVALTTVNGAKASGGISEKIHCDSSRLQSGPVEQKRNEDACGPSLLAGMYDRRTLLALDGWCEQLAWDNADIELSLLMNKMGIRVATSPVQVDCLHAAPRGHSNSTVKQLAELSVAYGVSGAGATTAMTDMLRGCLSGQISSAVAWATGILSGGRGVASIETRIQEACHNYAQLSEQRRVSSQLQLRRAA